MGTCLLVPGSHRVIKCSQFIIHRYLSWVSQYLNIPVLHCFSLLATEVQSQPTLRITLHITICSTQSFFGPFCTMYNRNPSSSLLSKMPKCDNKRHHSPEDADGPAKTLHPTPCPK